MMMNMEPEVGRDRQTTPPRTATRCTAAPSEPVGDDLLARVSRPHCDGLRACGSSPYWASSASTRGLPFCSARRGYSIVKSVGFVTLITTGGIPGFALAAYGLEKLGRKPTTVAVPRDVRGNRLHLRHRIRCRGRDAIRMP